MPYTKYPSPMPLLHVPTGGVGLGGFVEPYDKALTGVVIYLAHFGARGGSETLTAKIYTNPDLTAPVATSAATTLASLENIADDWAGWARLLFTSKYPLAADRQYYLGLTTANYTANGTTTFLAVQRNSHAPRNIPAWGDQSQMCKFEIEGDRQWPAL